MEDFDKTIEDMRNLQDYVSGKLVDKRSFVQFITAFTAQWKKAQSLLVSHIEEVSKKLTGKIDVVAKDVRKTEDSLRADIEKARQRLTEDITNTRSVVEAQIEENTKVLKSMIEEPTDFSSVHERIEELREQMPTEFSPKEIEDRIAELEDKIEEIGRRKGTTIVESIAGGVMGRDLVRDIDLSDQLDGVTKTFQTQAMHNVVTVALSSYPYGTLRKGIDYTWTPTSITFTDTIDAATQLAAGQQCILTIVQA